MSHIEEKVKKSLEFEHLSDVDISVPQELIDSDFHGPRIFIANAAFFMGGWEIPFDQKLNYIGTFHTDRDKVQHVEFMTLTGDFAFAENESLGSMMVELPYLHNAAVLVITMAKKRGGMALADRIRAEEFIDIQMRKRMKRIRVSLPKFDIQCTFGLESLLTHAGLKEVMRDDSNRAKITPRGNLRMSEGFHKAAMRK